MLNVSNICLKKLLIVLYGRRIPADRIIPYGVWSKKREYKFKSSNSEKNKFERYIQIFTKLNHKANSHFLQKEIRKLRMNDTNKAIKTIIK